MARMDAERDIEADKDVLRRRMRSFRAGLGKDLRERTDAAICVRLLATEEFDRAGTVLSYLSFGSEVDTHAIIECVWEAGKQVALPRVEGERAMGWYLIESFDGLARSSLGVEEPAPDPARRLDPAACPDAIALVPGLAFDRSCYRLGYGGGYYDSFLAGFAGTSVGLCREVQFIGSLDALGVLEEHDLPVGLVVTEDRLIRA